jgi:hypothetical protein
MALADPELFVEGSCGRPLPAGELLQVFKFGQFCPLKQLADGIEITVVVGRAPGEESEPNGSTSNAKRRARAAEGGAVTFEEVLADGQAGSAEDRADRVALAPQQVADAIATGTVRDRNGNWDVELSAPAIADLIDGRAVEVPASTSGEERRLLVAPIAGLAPRQPKEPNGGGEGGGGGGGGGPKVQIQLSHVVAEADLPAYLADPWVLDVNGQRMAIALTARHVTELTRDGATKVSLPEYMIRIRVEKAVKPPPDPAPEPTGTGSTTPTTEPSKPDPGTYDPGRVLDPSESRAIVLAVYFEWKQSWTLKGFSRGRLLQSLALGPQEETTIELFTWDRRKKTLEQSSSMESEQSIEDEEKTQDTTELLRELTKKDEFELKAGGSLDVQYNGGTVNVKLGGTLSGGQKTNSDDVTKTTTKAIKDALHKSAAKVKTQRSSKVTEATEFGSENRVTRKARNPNLCHTLNLDYFEILTHYVVTTEFNEDGMRFCAMIPNPVAERDFAPEFIRQHEGTLRDALLDRSLAPGFEAERFLRARKVELDELDAQRERREQQQPLHAPPVATPTPQAAVSPEESAANNHLANLQRAARSLMDATLTGRLSSALTALDLHNRPADGDLDAGKRWLAQQLFLRSFSQLALTLRELAKAADGPQIRDWGPRLDAVVPGPTSMPRPTQLNLEPQEVKEGVLKPIVEPRVGAAWNWGWWWGEIRRVGLLEAEDAGAGALIEQFSKVYRAFLEAAKGTSAAQQGAQVVEQAQQAQARQSEEDRLENDFPMRDYALAKERAEVLERHLREHADHYSFALFQALPPQEQLNHIELAMAGISTSFDPGFFQPRVVSQIGRRLLVPLNHQVIPKAAQLLATLKEGIAVPTETDTMLLPSPGMTIEARLGHCSAGEDFIEKSRELDLEMRRAQVRQAAAEAARLERRLSEVPARLDDPHTPVPRVAVELERPPDGVPR